MYESLRLGSLLRELRRNRGLTQQSAAEKLGVVHTTISQYESDSIEPGLPNLIKLARLYNERPLRLILVLMREHESTPDARDLFLLLEMVNADSTDWEFTLGTKPKHKQSNEPQVGRQFEQTFVNAVTNELGESFLREFAMLSAEDQEKLIHEFAVLWHLKLYQKKVHDSEHDR